MSDDLKVLGQIKPLLNRNKGKEKKGRRSSTSNLK